MSLSALEFGDLDVDITTPNRMQQHFQNNFGYIQCCDLKTLVSKRDCTQVHLVKVSVIVSRRWHQGLGLETSQ